MLSRNTLFGFALVIATTVIGVHAYNSNSSKTEGVVAECVGRGSPAFDPRPRCDETQWPVNVAIVCPPNCDELLNPPPRPNAAPNIKDTKKISTKKKSFLRKVHRHHHKSKVTHHHKSKPHHTNHHHHSHHHGHHHGGHSHSGPQKIPSHCAPPHLTGPPVCG